MNQNNGLHNKTINFPLQELRRIFTRKYIRDINFNIGSITFQDCVDILTRILLYRKNIVNGNFIEEFEEQFAKYVGARYAFSFGAGRMAFYAILKAMDIKEGDEVILPGYTCVVVPNAVIYRGAKPVYVDVDPCNFCINVDKIEEKISPKTKALVAQHMFASFCDMKAILNIARKYDLKVIEDCAHTLGAEYKGKKASTFGGDAAFFTFEQSKIMTTWMGGMAVTNDEGLAGKLKEIQNNTNFPCQKIVIKMAQHIIFYEIFGHPSTSFIGKYFLLLLYNLGVLTSNVTSEEKACRKPENYSLRLSNLQARIGLRQLAKIDANVEHRRKIASIYEKAFRNLGARTNEAHPLYNPACIRYAFLTRDRNMLKEKFRRNQIELGEWFNSPIYPKGSSLKNAYYNEGSCPVAEFLAEHSVNLPTHLKIKMKDVDRIIETLKNSKELLYSLNENLYFPCEKKW